MKVSVYVRRKIREGRKAERPGIWMMLTAFLLSLFTVTGYSFSKSKNLDFIIGEHGILRTEAVLAGILLYAVFYLLLRIGCAALDKQAFDGREGISFRRAFFVLTAAWLPYLIAYYPGIFMGDTGAQISQFFQLPNGTSNYLKLLSESQLINNHHPVLHTVLLGGAVKAGRLLFHSENAGLFCYTLFQYFCTAAAIACGVSYLKETGLPKKFQTAVLLIAAFYPVVPRYAVLLSKDTLFSSAVLVYMILLAKLLRSEGGGFLKKRRDAVLLFLSVLAVLFLRQNGLYVVIFSLPVLFLSGMGRRRRLRALLAFAGAVLLYIGCTQILYPKLEITPGSRREMLSIPFQQTARCVQEYGDQITEEEQDAIDRVLDYEEIKESYDPLIADPVKNTFREDADSGDMRAYFEVWLGMLKKYPRCYTEAALNQAYGYFYIGTNVDGRRTRYYGDFSRKCMEERINVKGFQFHNIESLIPLQKVLEGYSELILRLPVISWIQSSALYTWLLIFGAAFLMRGHRYRRLSLYLPAASLVLVDLLSPVNGLIYFRYMLPVMLFMPVLLGATFQEGESYDLAGSKRSEKGIRNGRDSRKGIGWGEPSGCQEGIPGGSWYIRQREDDASPCARRSGSSGRRECVD